MIGRLLLVLAEGPSGPLVNRVTDGVSTGGSLGPISKNRDERGDIDALIVRLKSRKINVKNIIFARLYLYTVQDLPPEILKQQQRAIVEARKPARGETGEASCS